MSNQPKAWANDIPVYCTHDKIRDGKEIDTEEYQALFEQPED